MDTPFWDIYRDIRSLIQKPDEAVYILYTTIGAITVRKFVYRAEAGYVFFAGYRREREGSPRRLFGTTAFHICI